jgi:hypothetical protein
LGKKSRSSSHETRKDFYYEYDIYFLMAIYSVALSIDRVIASKDKMIKMSEVLEGI